MKALLQRIEAGEILVGDGAMGTLLFEKGLPRGGCPESVNLDRPELLEEIAHAYLEAGADLIETNTFGASPPKLAEYQFADHTEEINRAAVRAVRNVVGDRAFVSASCGPSGRMLKPYGDTEPDELSDGFRRQIEALIDAGADCICVETMIDLTEATLAVRAAKELSPTTPVLATMTFDPTPKGFHTVMGVSIEQAIRGLAEAGADVVGSNCGHGIETMAQIATEFRKHTDRPLLIQSNAGLPQLVDGKSVYIESPPFMAEKANALLAAGVSIIGGCCGTTPDHIRAIRQVVDGTTKR